VMILCKNLYRNNNQADLSIEAIFLATIYRVGPMVLRRAQNIAVIKINMSCTQGKYKVAGIPMKAEN
jgi:hypothetical protein